MVLRGKRDSVGTAVSEFVTKTAPVLRDEGDKARKRAVVRIEEQLRRCAHLRGPVPPVAAVVHHRHSLAVQQQSHALRRGEHRAHLLEPACVVQLLQPLPVAVVDSGRDAELQKLNKICEYGGGGKP